MNLDSETVPGDNTTTLKADSEPLELKAHSSHSAKATRFVYEALASVVCTPIAVEGWAANDYVYVAKLAHSLENELFPLSSLIWDEERGVTKAMSCTAQAVSVYIAHEAKRVRASGDEDEQADADNDHAYLRTILKLDVENNPLVTIA